MKKISAAALLLIVLTASNSYAVFSDFQTEGQQLAELIKCPNAKVSSTEGLPNLWGCIWPTAEVVKIFINAKEDNVGVENIKVMWNDWTKDTGYGVHTDKDKAEAWVKTVAEKYAPEQTSEVLSAFRENEKKIIENKNYVLTYTYEVGPAIDERLIVITEKIAK